MQSAIRHAPPITMLRDRRANTVLFRKLRRLLKKSLDTMGHTPLLLTSRYARQGWPVQKVRMSVAWKLVRGRTNTCSRRANFCALAAPFVGGPHKWRSLRLSRRFSMPAEKPNLTQANRPKSAAKMELDRGFPWESASHDIRQLARLLRNTSVSRS